MSRVDRINAGFSNFERIRKIVLLDGELTPENGLLTPSHKVRRRIVAKTFAVQIDALYKEEAD